MKKICCFGELLLRISPAPERAWIRDAALSAFIGGSELNVANALAQWGRPVKYLSAIADNSITGDILTELSEAGIDVSEMHFSGDRLGLYFLTQGADLKHTSVIYDRAHSSFSGLSPGELDWKHLFRDVDWFHFSAISPALNDNSAAVCLEAVEQAKAMEIPVSIDLNYRSRLWQNRDPISIMPNLAAHCDLIMGNIWSMVSLLGIESVQITDKDLSKSVCTHYAQGSAIRIMKQFPKCKTVAFTFRFDEAGGIRYFGTMHKKDFHYSSPEFRTDQIIDRVGSGDCFMAGLIFGLSQSWPGQQVIDFSAAAAFGKLGERGDFTRQTKESIFSSLEKFRE